MATAKLIPIVSSPQHNPAVEPISQFEIELFLALRNRLKQIQTQIDEHETSFTARLESGAGVEPGVRVAKLGESFRRNVSWKAVTVRLAERLKLGGAKYAARVIAATKPSRTVSLEVH